MPGQNTDLMYVERAGVPFKATAATLKAFFNDGVGDRKRVANIAARDALTGLDDVDVVLVDDASADATVTSGWAIYHPTTVTAGAADDWVKGANQEQLNSTIPSTNLSITPSPIQLAIGSSTGSGIVLPLATATNAGLLSPAEKTAITNIHPAVTTSGTATTNPMSIVAGTQVMSFSLANLASLP